MRRIFLFAMSALAALSSADSKVVLGRLGRAKTSVQIYSAPSAKARVVSRVPQGTTMAVRSDGGKWLTVVMNGGKIAYIPGQSVEVLPYEVVMDQSSVTSRPTTTTIASRGGNVMRGGTDPARAKLAQYAQQFEGTTPYKWGGNDIGTGIDCSGFVKKMYGAIGLSLPRTAAEQAMVGQPILNYQDLRPGDRLYFWDAGRGKIGHTGIYLGGDKQGRAWFVHSSSGHKGIAKDILSARWQKICVAARR